MQMLRVSGLIHVKGMFLLVSVSVIFCYFLFNFEKTYPPFVSAALTSRPHLLHCADCSSPALIFCTCA